MTTIISVFAKGFQVGAFPEAMAGGRLDPEDPLPPLRNVQVELDDPPLGEVPLQAPGEYRLLQFPDRVFRRGEVEILQVKIEAKRSSGKIWFDFPQQFR